MSSDARNLLALVREIDDRAFASACGAAVPPSQVGFFTPEQEALQPDDQRVEYTHARTTARTFAMIRSTSLSDNAGERGIDTVRSLSHVALGNSSGAHPNVS